MACTLQCCEVYFSMHAMENARKNFDIETTSLFILLLNPLFPFIFLFLSWKDLNRLHPKQARDVSLTGQEWPRCCLISVKSKVQVHIDRDLQTEHRPFSVLFQHVRCRQKKKKIMKNMLMKKKIVQIVTLSECLAKVWLLFQNYLYGEHENTVVLQFLPSILFGGCYIVRAVLAFNVPLESGMLSQQNCITVMTMKRNAETAPSLKGSFIFL